MTAAQLRDWVDVAARMLVVVAIGLVLLAPNVVPILHYFLITHGKVNIFGSEFEFTQTSALAPGLEIKDGKLLLGGREITALPDTLSKLQTDNDELTATNRRLAKQIDDTEKLLEDVRKQRDDANGQLAQLQSSTPGIKPIQTQDLDKQLARQLQQNRQTASALALAPVVAAAAPAPAAEALYGVVFSSDISQEEAATEVKKARKLTSFTIAIVKRGRFLASVGVFPSRDAAVAALPTFQSANQWKGPYIVDFRLWCPAALAATFANNTLSTQVDCGF